MLIPPQCVLSFPSTSLRLWRSSHHTSHPPLTPLLPTYCRQHGVGTGHDWLLRCVGDPIGAAAAGCLAMEPSMERHGPSHVGELVRRYRIAAALSQEALAERASVSVRAVSDLE